MSGFIERLVARARGAEAVRPRLPSRFEGQKATPLPQVEDEGVGPSPRSSTAAGHALVDLEVSTPRGHFEPLAHDAAFAPRRADASEPARSRYPAPALAADRNASRGEAPMATAASPSRALSAGPLEPRLRAQTGHAREPTALTAPSRSTTDTESPTPAMRAPTAPLPTTASTPAPRPAIEPMRAKPPAALPITPRRAEPPQSTRRPIVAETTVSVSIGRLEVRLSPDRTAHGAPREAARTPVMSLDDYLRSRSGR